MTSVDHPDALPGGYRVQEFKLLSVLGVGGFGITYLAKDTLLDRTVAIKEYFPRDFAVRTEDHSIRPRSPSESENYTWGLERFWDEAKTLAQLNHPSIVRVYKHFETHGSGYIVMEYVEGETLGERLKRESTLDGPRLMAILNSLIEGLEQVHAAGYLHRDITPKNILLRKDGSPVLIDFGSARQAIGARSRSVTAVATPGYAPLEQYSTRGRQQGPWTDIYGLSAVAYRCITGTAPKDATERAQGEALTSASELAEGQYAKGLLTAVYQGLTVKVEERPKDLKAWRSLWVQKEKQQRYRLAAKQGDAGAQQAAEQGYDLAQNSLGWMYKEGRGVPQDDVEAVKWFQRAAEQGLAWAHLRLGLMYEEGRGIAQNHVEAHKWYSLAISRFSSDDRRLDKSRKLRDKIAEKMTRKEVATAWRLAREWQPKTWNQLKAERAHSSTAAKAKKQEVKQSEIKSTAKKKVSHVGPSTEIFWRNIALVSFFVGIIVLLVIVLETFQAEQDVEELKLAAEQDNGEEGIPISDGYDHRRGLDIIPSRLINTFYHYHGKRHKWDNADELKKYIATQGSVDTVDDMADSLYEWTFKDKMTREEFDEKSGYNEWKKEISNQLEKSIPQNNAETVK